MEFLSIQPLPDPVTVTFSVMEEDGIETVLTNELLGDRGHVVPSNSSVIT